MNEWRSDWDQKMARPPFKERRFTADMMEDVEKRLENVRKKRNRRGRVRSAIIIVPVMLLVFGAGSIWIGDQTAHSPKQVTPSLAIQGEERFNPASSPVQVAITIGGALQIMRRSKAMIARS